MCLRVCVLAALDDDDEENIYGDWSDMSRGCEVGTRTSCTALAAVTVAWNDSTADNFLASCFVLAGSHTEATQMAMLDSFKTAWIHTLNDSCVYNFSVISAPLIGSP